MTVGNKSDCLNGRMLTPRTHAKAKSMYSTYQRKCSLCGRRCWYLIIKTMGNVIGETFITRVGQANKALDINSADPTKIILATVYLMVTR